MTNYSSDTTTTDLRIPSNISGHLTKLIITFLTYNPHTTITTIVTELELKRLEVFPVLSYLQRNNIVTCNTTTQEYSLT